MRHVYRVVVEKDEIYSTRSGKPRHMVAILRESDSVVGIPMRDVSKEEAEKARESIQFAFDFGLRETKSIIEQFSWTTGFQVLDGGGYHADNS